MLKFAFSSVADLSIEEMRVALVGYLLSRQRSQQFIAHVADLGEADHAPSKAQDTLALLKKFAIEQDQLFYQSERLGRYQQFALRLIEQDKAFACICETEDAAHCCHDNSCLRDQKQISQRIKTEKLPFAICIKAPETAIFFTDMVQGRINTDPSEMSTFTLLKTDGTPTREFASACDDLLSGVTLVVHSEKYPDTLSRQTYIKQSLGYTANTEYLQLPALLSKGEACGSVKALLEEGLLPDAILNHLLSLGIRTPDLRFTLPEALAWFDLDKLSRDPVAFDKKRLYQLNREHLEAMDPLSLSRIFGFADADIGALLKLYLPEAQTINALEKRIKAIFAPKPCTGEASAEMRHIAAVIQTAPMLDTFEAFTQHIVTQSGTERERLSKPLRYLMTGTQSGPELQAIYATIKPYITEIARCTP